MKVEIWDFKKVQEQMNETRKCLQLEPTITMEEVERDQLESIWLIAENEEEEKLLEAWQHFKACPQLRTHKNSLHIYFVPRG